MKNKIRDSKWSKEVMALYGNKCPCCGKIASGGPHHIIPRENKNTRWIIQNGIATCNSLHRLFEGNKVERDNAILAYVGLKKYFILLGISEGIVSNVKYKEIK